MIKTADMDKQKIIIKKDEKNQFSFKLGIKDNQKITKQ